MRPRCARDPRVPEALDGEERGRGSRYWQRPRPGRAHARVLGQAAEKPTPRRFALDTPPRRSEDAASVCTVIEQPRDSCSRGSVDVSRTGRPRSCRGVGAVESAAQAGPCLERTSYRFDVSELRGFRDLRGTVRSREWQRLTTGKWLRGAAQIGRDGCAATGKVEQASARRARSIDRVHRAGQYAVSME